jgi:hypothetical protein
MPSQSELDCWIDEVSSAFSGLSRPQAQVLALYSYGMAMLCQCGLTTVSYFIGELFGMKWEAVRRRLREWTYEAAAKRGQKRCSVDVEAQFAPLLRWVMSHWRDKRQLVLALDVTYLRQRHTILAVSVVYGGSAIPVAWHVMRGETQGAWHALWVALLRRLAPAIPRQCQVWVLCDEGLYSKRLFHEICQHGWHPVMRIRTQGVYRRANGRHWRRLDTVAQRGMKARAWRGQCFKGDPLTCTLWVQWAAGYDQPCLLVTDLVPKHLKRHVYGLRSWIEGGFKDLKRGGLHWEQSKTPCPDRMARLLLVMALAIGWLVVQGVTQTVGEAHAAPAPLSLMRRGWIRMLVAAIRQQPTAFAFWPPYRLPPFPA